jgi:hypothetical protein
MSTRADVLARRGARAAADKEEEEEEEGVLLTGDEAETNVRRAVMLRKEERLEREMLF